MTSRLRRTTARAVSVLGIAIAQLRRSPGRTALAAAAVGLAVLSVTLLASLGVGVFEVGQESLDEADRDIWITSDPLDASSGGAENPIVDSHAIAADVTDREGVRYASPIAIHSVYVGTDPEALRPVTAVGVQGTHDGFQFKSGGGFAPASERYADDPPDDPGTSDVVLDPRLAAQLDVSVGDTVYVGTSRASADVHGFTVAGTSAYHSQFLGEPAVTVPLVELQGIAGTRGTDRASFIAVDVTDGADREAVRNELAAAYPTYDVRTSDDQLAAMVEDRALVVASGVTLVGLAVVGGVVLTVNLFVLVAYQQRTELAALKAIGLSRGVLAGTIGAQAFVIGLLGGFVALAATPPITRGLNRLAEALVGFDDLLRTPAEVYVVGAVVALGVGTVAAVVTGWRAGRYGRIEFLEV